MAEKSGTRRVARADLQSKSISSVHDHIGGPKLDVDGVDFVRHNREDICRAVLSVGKPRPMKGMIRFCLSHAYSEEAFGHRRTFPRRTGVEDLRALGRDMSETYKQVQVRRDGIIRALADGNIEMSDNVSGNLDLFFKRRRW